MGIGVCIEQMPPDGYRMNSCSSIITDTIFQIPGFIGLGMHTEFGKITDGFGHDPAHFFEQMTKLIKSFRKGKKWGQNSLSCLKRVVITVNRRWTLKMIG